MKEILNRKGTSGISLVALIVTIIVLIILTAAVIVTFMEGGIVDKAKKAVFRSDIRNYQDILLVKNAEKKIDRETGTGLEEGYQEITKTGKDEIKTVIPEFKDEYDGVVDIENGKLVLGTNVLVENPEGKYARYKEWLIELGIEAGSGASAGGLSENAIAKKVAVGDYVNYDTLISGERDYTIDEGDTSWICNDANGSWSYNSGEETIARRHINWRVLSNNGSTVTLISEEPIDKIYLKGANGYLYGPNKLDEIYGDLYSVSGKGSARNLRVEDVNTAMSYTASTATYYDNNWDEQTVEYETTIGALETTLGSTLSNRTGPRASGADTDDIGSYPLTYYHYSGNTYKTDDNTTAYNLIFKNPAGTSNASTYWLSSSCVFAYFGDDYAYFGVRYVDDGGVNAVGLYISNGGGDSYSYAGRPVVVLSSNVQVVESEGTHTTSGTAWEIQ